MSKMNAFHFLNDFCALILKTDSYILFYAKNDGWVTRQDKTRQDEIGEGRARGRMGSCQRDSAGIDSGAENVIETCSLFSTR
ncbi:hypothetical protein QSU96_04305 [Vibrio furnissii]|uniref:hypothetical protein n=1 Tax=Vibrio furnissii TaxID=29494 RepID=UPI0025723619|nr:hypothetical protein [Vibrio furnissii]WJG26950.1 hypothetical protein QSU96_04305 [Vibrio furnissii]